MADLEYNGMTIDFKKFGEHDGHVRYLSLDRVYKPQELAALLFPAIVAEEAKLHAPPAPQPASGNS